jgi:hypothetical protein
MEELKTQTVMFDTAELYRRPLWLRVLKWLIPAILLGALVAIAVNAVNKDDAHESAVSSATVDINSKPDEPTKDPVTKAAVKISKGRLAPSKEVKDSIPHPISVPKVLQVDSTPSVNSQSAEIGDLLPQLPQPPFPPQPLQ